MRRPPRFCAWMSGEAACPTQRASRSVADGVAATAAANRSTRISGATAIGANGTERSRRGADEALAPTDFGKWLKDDHSSSMAGSKVAARQAPQPCHAKGRQLYR